MHLAREVRARRVTIESSVWWELAQASCVRLSLLQATGMAACLHLRRGACPFRNHSGSLAEYLVAWQLFTNVY